MTDCTVRVKAKSGLQRPAEFKHLRELTDRRTASALVDTLTSGR
jgi:hypothetical protein